MWKLLVVDLDEEGCSTSHVVALYSSRVCVGKTLTKDSSTTSECPLKVLVRLLPLPVQQGSAGVAGGIENVDDPLNLVEVRGSRAGQA